MSFIRLGFDDPGFTQILSFRRQIFIDPEDVNKIPKEFTVYYEERYITYTHLLTRLLVLYVIKKATLPDIAPRQKTRQEAPQSQQQ